MPTLCLIILNYYSYQNTEKCVESLKDQPLDTLYLVDNSENSEQAEAIISLAKKLRQQNIEFEIVVLISEENAGFGGGINQAIKNDYQQTGGHRHYLLLNNDTILPANTLKVLLEEKQQRPNVALLSPRINWGGRMICYYRYVALIGHVSDKLNRFSQAYLSGCCLLVDSVLIDEDISLFDEDFFMYGEDIRLNWKARKLGKDIFCTEKVTIFHQGSASSSQGGFFYEYHVARGHVLLGLKVDGGRYKKMAFVSGRLVYLFLRAVVRCWRYRSSMPLYAYLMAWFPIKVRIQQ